MKRKIAILLALQMGLFSACGNVANTEEAENKQSGNIEKPEEISIMTNTFMPWEDNDADVKMFCDEYERITGIKLKVQIPQKDEYYEKLNILLATDNSVDLFETGCLFYPNYAMYDLLWDMTDAWEVSEIKNITDEKYIDSLRVNGRLYGFPLTAGNGTVTYVRKDWLDKLNISQPTTYDEFHDMLKKFKTLGDDIIPLTAAGLVNSESPYSLYLREFYQDANPDFYLKGDKYVDGMTEPEMKEALIRMKSAYEEGLLDKDIVKNKTSNCRDKFYDGVVGCFNYWAGTWGKTMNQKVKAKDPSGEVIALKPLNNIKYLERPPLAMVISNNSKSPEGVFKYLVEFSHDGGEGQMLFTYGLENRHWRKISDTKAEIIKENALNSIYLKPDLSINSFADPIPVDPEIAAGVKMFNENSTLASIPVTSKKTGDLFSDVDIIRREIIEAVVTTDMTVEDGLKEYNTRASKLVTRVLNSLNDSDSNEETNENIEVKEGY